MDKKEFQKFVKGFRLPGKEFPKAMMHDSQIRGRTATINCGNMVSATNILDRLISPEFNEFLASQKARYIIEDVSRMGRIVSKQVRIYW